MPTTKTKVVSGALPCLCPCWQVRTGRTTPTPHTPHGGAPIRQWLSCPQCGHARYMRRAVYPHSPAHRTRGSSPKPFKFTVGTKLGAENRDRRLSEMCPFCFYDCIQMMSTDNCNQIKSSVRPSFWSVLARPMHQVHRMISARESSVRIIKFSNQIKSNNTVSGVRFHQFTSAWQAIRHRVVHCNG
jgi:hypothetical protein